MSDLWEHEDPITDLDIEVPSWIDQDICPSTVASILQGGCSSGAYMPAVIYYQANKTMSEHGDDVLTFIEDHYGEVPAPDMTDMSWDGLAVFFLSVAVECWACSVEEEITDALDALEDEED